MIQPATANRRDGERMAPDAVAGSGDDEDAAPDEDAAAEPEAD